jgi:hypothetical protein
LQSCNVSLVVSTISARRYRNLGCEILVSFSIRGNGASADFGEHVDASERVGQTYLLSLFLASPDVADGNLERTKARAEYFSANFGVQAESALA